MTMARWPNDPMTSSPDLALDVRAELGEGPVWDVPRQRLWFVDIMRGHVHQFDPTTRGDRVFEIGQPVSAVVPTSAGGLMMAVKDGFARLDVETGEVTSVARIEGARSENRMNDGACDGRGRFWAGTLAMDHAQEQAALYRLDPDGTVTTQLTGVTNSNGIDWSPDNRLMYYVDTGTRRIDVCEFDLDRGAFANRRPLVTIADSDGKPDGLIVDADGGVWIALWGGGAVRRYGPDGRLDREIALPVPDVTKCAFGGADLADLYITTARGALSEAEGVTYPQAGGLFHCRPGLIGKRPNAFIG